QITPVISPNAIICRNGSAQLNATGGTIYTWKPATGLNNANIANPISTPSSNITYTVIVSNGTCADSGVVSVNISPDPVAVVSAGTAICSNANTQLTASGGTSYSWQPAMG